MVIVGFLLAASAWSAAPPAKWRALTADEQKVVDAFNERLIDHLAAGEFEQIVNVAEQVVAYRQRRQGAAHWQVIDARFEAQRWQRLVPVRAKDSPELARAMGLTGRGLRLLAGGHSREAEKPLREAIAIFEKVHGKKHPETADRYTCLAKCLRDQGELEEALSLSRKALLIIEKSLGPEHPETASGHDNVAVCLHKLGKTVEALSLFRKVLLIREKSLGLGHPSTAESYSVVAACLHAQGKHAEALPLFRKALLILEKARGPNDTHTARGYERMADCLKALGKYREALPPYRKALQIHAKALGLEHPDTATSYIQVAACLQDLGKSDEALPLYKTGLAIHEKVLGAEHRDTAASYHNVAACLHAQGKHAEALPLFRKTLVIIEKVRGQEHQETAASYDSVASCLKAQGKHAEAFPLHRKALQIREKVLGLDHPSTSASYNNVAACLNDLGKSAEALPLFRQVLQIREKVQGESHPDTAGSYNNLASCLDALGKHSEALPLYQKALRTFEKVLGEGHAGTATGYNNVAFCLHAQGKYAKALPLFIKALHISEKAQGQEHPDTAHSYNNLALCLWDHGRRSEAVRLLQGSWRSHEAARVLRAESGFDRAQQTRDVSPRAELAVGLAGLKQPGNAFAHAEASLARGLLDDLSPLSRAEMARGQSLRARLARLEPVLASLAASGELSEEQKARRDEARLEYRRLWQEWSDLRASASDRAVLPLWRIQKSIPADAALVLWVWGLNQLWGCVVRREGTPLWLPLLGTDRDNAPTEDNLRLWSRLFSVLIDPTSDSAQRQKLLAACRKQRLEPLRPHLKGVKRLFVVPTGVLARIPVEVICDEYSVTYVPSGSVLARLRESHRAVDGSSLLAVGDPTFETTPPPAPPASGVLILSVLPGSNASKAGLQSGDVLLSIGSVAIDSAQDLPEALKQAPASITYWRDGQRVKGRLPASPLGASIDERSVRAAVRAWRKAQEAMAQRGTGHKRLPGTRIESEAIASLVKGSTLLLGSQASEQQLDELIDTDKLKGYRLLHIATHGETDEHRPSRSAVILAQDRLPDPLQQARQGRHVYDGRLTVSRIRTHWKGKIDADLVVLSACETALGQDAKGEGLLGFAQAFLSAGARSVILSRWKVDDTATSLLMIRFYENLLGKRAGLKKALGRAASLDEAKKWLRTLSRKQAEHLATLHSGGVLRGSEGDEKPPAKVKPVELRGDKPYEHPFFWAAFTLIGDPD
jgi:tetratricopeptide (TPR) repeat protein